MLGILAIMLFVFSSCKKEEAIVSNLTGESEDITPPVAKVAGVTYTHIPGLNVAVSDSKLAVVLTGSCGSHSGSILSAKVTYQSPSNGDQFTIQVFKQGNGTFSSSGTAYIRAASVCGGIGNSASYSAGTASINLPITATFSRGLTHFYPITVDASGNRYYAEPVLVYTTPMYDATWTYGAVLGTVNGVELKCNANTTNQHSTNTYQCTEFCIRYYSQVYGRNISGMGDATNWFANSSTKALQSFPNITTTTAPRPGDILCMSGGIGNPPLGHVAIITRVESNYIQFAHQNSGTSWAPIGAQLTLTKSGSSYTVSNPSGYTIQGWLRAPAY